MKLSLFRNKSLVEYRESRENIKTRIKGHLINVKSLVYNNLVEKMTSHTDYLVVAIITYYLTRVIFS